MEGQGLQPAKQPTTAPAGKARLKKVRRTGRGGRVPDTASYVLPFATYYIVCMPESHGDAMEGGQCVLDASVRHSAAGATPAR